jgi:hypothetical protein
MNRDNTPVFQTKNSRVYHFNDFEKNIQKEKDELDKVDRSFLDNEGEIGNLPNKTKYKFNKVTRKMDDLSKDMIEDSIDAIEDMGVKHTDHKFKIVDMKKESNDFSDLESSIIDILNSKLSIYLPSDGDVEIIDPESIKESAKKIIKLLKKQF